MYTICVMVKDKRMIILYAIISCDQPLFTLNFSVWEISRGFFSHFHSLSLSLSPLSHSLSLSYLSLPLYISTSTFLSLSLLSIILFGLSNGRFRPCFIIHTWCIKDMNWLIQQKLFSLIFIVLLSIILIEICL